LGCCRGPYSQGKWANSKTGPSTTPLGMKIVYSVYLLYQRTLLRNSGMLKPQQDSSPIQAFTERYINTCILGEPNGSYIACFPWKADPLTNYTACARRLQTLIQKLKTTLSLLTTYTEILATQERHGFIEKVQQLTKCHCIPHYAIRNISHTNHT